MVFGIGRKTLIIQSEPSECHIKPRETTKSPAGQNVECSKAEGHIVRHVGQIGCRVVCHTA